jgi:predicted regulator of Ras-like GTPase activity (Roadblock/LC7/MglB family)
MTAITQELALRYLLELSADIRAAFLVDGGGGLLAAAPDPPSERITALGAELVTQARAIAAEQGEDAVELDVSVDGGSAFVVIEDGPALVCVTGQLALPGLIIHDMRVALDDLRRSEAPTP